MSDTVHYKGSFYFVSLSELKEAMRLIVNETSQKCLFWVNERERKLTIEVCVPFEKRGVFQIIFSKAATHAAEGMLMVYYNDAFTDVICANRKNKFSPDKPGVIMFTLQEFEETFGKLDMEISKVVYDSPFYIYDYSLKGIAMKFPDEDPISDEDCDIGFAALEIIWRDYVALSDSRAVEVLFKFLEGSKEDTVAIQPNFGFAPGYTFIEAMDEARRKNFLVYRWSDFWDNKYEINDYE